MEFNSISQLNELIRNTLNNNFNLKNIKVCGEISGINFRNPHLYFTIKDSNAAISCQFFNYYFRDGYIPKNGDNIEIEGSISFYTKSGQISIIIRSIHKLGLGELYEKYLQLKEKLNNEGYFNEEHKKEIPSFPQKIGVITSKTSAAVEDFKKVFKDLNSQQELYIFDARMQGVESVKSIIEGINYLDNKEYDCIAIVRGGGSFEDLNCFNNEELVKAIYNCKTPILTGIGHEIDYTLVDYVSDRRCITPTETAKVIAYDRNDIINEFYTRILEVKNLINSCFFNEANFLINKEKIMKTMLESNIKNEQFSLKNILSTIKFTLCNEINKKFEKNTQMRQIILESNPELLLKDNYF
nr:exodeoxyribonuclease VII large subunit [Clostridia bacterium]